MNVSKIIAGNRIHRLNQRVKVVMRISIKIGGDYFFDAPA